MLLVQAEAAPPQRHEHLLAELARRPRAVVHHLGRRHAQNLPPRLAHPPAPVNLLAVHEEPVVQRPHLADGFRAHHQRRAQWVIHGERLRARVQAARVAAVEPRVQQTMVEREEVQQNLREAGEAEGRMLERAVGIDQPRAHRADVGPPVQRAHQGAQGVAAHLGVGIEQQHVPRVGSGDGLIVGGGEPAILRVGDEARLGELRPHHVGAAVRRGVVHDPDLAAQGGSLQARKRRAQARPCQLAGVVTDNNDGEVIHRPPAFRHWRSAISRQPSAKGMATCELLAPAADR